MAIILVNEDALALSSGIDDQYKRTYTRGFDVFTDDRTHGPAFVRANLTPPGAAGPLAPGTAYWVNATEQDAGARLLKLDVSLVDLLGASPVDGTAIAGFAFRAAASYGFWDPQAHTDDGDPVNQPPEVRIEGVNGEEVAKKDIFGSPIVNAAGDPFDPPLMRDRARCVIRVGMNLLAPDKPTLLGYANQVNLAAWFGFPERTVKVAPPKLQKLYSQFLAGFYWRVEFEFEYNPDTWDAHILNCGYTELYTDAGTTKRRKVLGDDGQAVGSPAMLDVSGHYIAPPYDLDSTADDSADIGPGDTDTEPTAPGTASPIVFLTFEVYEKLDFDSAFGFPTDLFD